MSETRLGVESRVYAAEPSGAKVSLRCRYGSSPLRGSVNGRSQVVVLRHA